ncbi:MAG TPA: acyl-CoA dehydrogenase family protein [Castellaniella sp.]|nr:acyl-CoA dehydrogenase family protein [Castellaniella sp.]
MKLLEQLADVRRWNMEERQILAQVQRVADDVIAPNAERIDHSGDFPWENVQALNALGLNTLFIPESFGGLGMSYALYLEVVSIIAEACASTGIIYATNFHGVKPIIQYGSQEQCARWLPRMLEGGLAALAITEPDAGSDATGMRTRFTPDGDDIIVHGSKIFITNGDVADLYLVFGRWSGIEDIRGSMSALIIEKGTPGFQALSRLPKMGLNGSATCGLAFEQCRVPRRNLLRAPGDGFEILLSSLNKSRPSVAAHARGIARAAFKDMVRYGNERTQGGKRVLDFQGNQFTLADLAAELAMVERWMDYVAQRVDRDAEGLGLEASVAKLRATDLAMRMASECVQFHGGYGYCRGYRAERLMRDAKITQIWEGTNQVHRQLIGRSFLNK